MCVHIYAHVHILTHMHMCAYIHAYICTHIHTYIYSHTYLHTFTHMYIHIIHRFTRIYTIYSHTHQLSPSGAPHGFRTEYSGLDNQSWGSSLEKTSLPSLSTHWSGDPRNIPCPHQHDNQCCRCSGSVWRCHGCSFPAHLRHSQQEAFLPLLQCSLSQARVSGLHCRPISWASACMLTSFAVF